MRRLSVVQVGAACLLALGLALALQAEPVQAAPPRRIVSLNLCTDQILLQLVPRERIAALGWLSQDASMAALHREAQGLRTVRGSAEEVIALRPDLVLAGTMTTRHTTALLRAFGIPVLTLPGAESFAQVRAQLRSVARAVGEVQRGEDVIAAMSERQAALVAQAKQGATSGGQRVATTFWAGGRSAGRRTLYDDLLAAAGYANGGARAGLDGYGTLPLEKLVAQAPDLLLTNDYKRGVPTQGNRLLAHPAVQSMEAARATLPSRLTICGGPWNLDAAALLAAQLAAQGRGS